MNLFSLNIHISCYNWRMNDETESNSSPSKVDEYLHKHVNAVALVPVKGGRRISLLGRRVFNILLHRSMEDGDHDEYHARLHEIVKDTGYTSENTAYIKKILRELMSTTVEWQSPTDSEQETWDACNLLSGAGITKDKRTGAVTIRWRFDNQVRAQLLRPDRYARLSIDAITQLSSHAAMALYEICARYVDNPGHKTARQHWRWWHPVLTGISTDNSKAEYRFFKRDFINKAVAEINRLTNLEVKGPIEYKERDNKTIADIQFEVYLKKEQKNESNQKPLVFVEVTDLPIIGRAITFGIKQKEAETLLRKFGVDLLTIAIGEFEKRLQMPVEIVGEVINPNNWIKSILKRLATEKSEQEKPVIVTKERQRKQRSEWNDEWLIREKDSLLQDFKDKNEIDQQDELKEFHEILKKSNQIQILKRFEIDSWDHRMVRATFIKFLGIRKSGDLWDKPTADDLLTIASEIACRNGG